MSAPTFKGIDTVKVVCPCGEVTEFVGIEPGDLDAHISQPCDGGCGKTVEIFVEVMVQAR